MNIFDICRCHFQGKEGQFMFSSFSFWLNKAILNAFVDYTSRSVSPRPSDSPGRGRRSRSLSRPRRSRSRYRSLLGLYNAQGWLILSFSRAFGSLRHWQLSSCYRSCDSDDAANPGNNLYVTGLSTRVTTSDLEKYFGKEGKVWIIQFVIIAKFYMYYLVLRECLSVPQLCYSVLLACCRNHSSLLIVK